MSMASFPTGNNSPVPGLPQSWSDVTLRQAPAISRDAAALADYSSPNQFGVAINSLDKDPELSKLRGTSSADDEIHKLVSWTTRKDYPTMVGISLPIKNWVGEDYHPIQFWEETTEPIGALDNPAADMYVWLISRLRERSQSQSIPIGMPEIFSDLSVQTSRTGEAGYILYEPLDSLAGRITNSIRV
jgi:hypothetical protein